MQCREKQMRTLALTRRPMMITAVLVAALGVSACASTGGLAVNPVGGAKVYDAKRGIDGATASERTRQRNRRALFLRGAGSGR